MRRDRNLYSGCLGLLLDDVGDLGMLGSILNGLKMLGMTLGDEGILLGMQTVLLMLRNTCEGLEMLRTLSELLGMVRAGARARRCFSSFAS